MGAWPGCVSSSSSATDWSGCVGACVGGGWIVGLPGASLLLQHSPSFVPLDARFFRQMPGVWPAFSDSLGFCNQNVASRSIGSSSFSSPSSTFFLCHSHSSSPSSSSPSSSSLAIFFFSLKVHLRPSSSFPPSFQFPLLKICFCSSQPCPSPGTRCHFGFGLL